jgi:diguanylate cyclase (GGDEF)-like protein
MTMSTECRGCSCSFARTTASSGRLLFATQVDHTLRALSSLAVRQGFDPQTLAPGLLAVDTDDALALIADACQVLSSVEADEVRCMVQSGSDLSEASMVAQAMSAPSLAAAGARVLHADLLPLFADEKRCFHAVYQPIVSLPDRHTLAYEALLRAETADGVRVMPDLLFPAAEAAGWIHLLDRVGRTTALRDASGWLGDKLLFINFIPTSIYRPEVCLRTTEIAAAQAGVRLDQLVFEVTEGHEVTDLDHLQRVFDYYRSRNCKVALDDMGAGYSSLNMLVRLQPDVVKLDKDIVQALPGPTSMAVVAAIVEIAHSYGGLVLAECVETTEQAEAAIALGVDLAQGWLFGRPVRRTPKVLAPVIAATPVVVASIRPHLPDPAVALAAEPDTDTNVVRADTAASVLLVRAGLEEHLELALAAAKRDQRAVVALCVELDGLEGVDGPLGHAAANTVVAQAVERIRAVLRSVDALARLSDDEFVAVLADLDPFDGARIAQRSAHDIVASLQRPFTVGSQRFVLSGHIGVSIYPDDALTVGVLLAQSRGSRTRSGGRGAQYGLNR